MEKWPTSCAKFIRFCLKICNFMFFLSHVISAFSFNYPIPIKAPYLKPLLSKTCGRSFNLKLMALSSNNLNSSPECGITLESLRFDNRCLRVLPIDSEPKNFIRPSVPNSCFSKVQPAPLENPELVSVSTEALGLLGLSEEECRREDALAEYFSGNKLLPGAEPAAHCYCGHQFGSFSGQLGDGAAMYLGEVLNEKGERWEIQFKGAGPTPYSRSADGRKVLRSSLREYLCSEAMHHLGVPTTRAGTIVTSDTKVMRDIFYNGNVIYEKATVILRIAPTFLRFGSFEIFKPRDAHTGRKGPSVGNSELLHLMLNFAVDSYFPEIAAQHPTGSKQRYLAMYKQVVKSTAKLVASWQSVGFTHGVLNTDNMSLLGLTIDYGPFGFMEYFDPDYVPNGSDHGGRYSYQAQPEICRWNLQKFAEALALGAVPLEELLEVLEQEYWPAYGSAFSDTMKAKLGLELDGEEDMKLISDLFDTLEATAADFTTVFRLLGRFSAVKEGAVEELSQSLADCCATPAILDKALQRSMKITRPSMNPGQVQQLYDLIQNEPERAALMFDAPLAAVKEEIEGELKKMEKALQLMGRIEQVRKVTNDEKKAQDKVLWQQWLNSYKARLELETVPEDERNSAMAAVNPSFVLRNWVAQDAIEAAENRDYEKVENVMKMLRFPFKEVSYECENERETGEQLGTSSKYTKPPVESNAGLICTCSS